MAQTTEPPASAAGLSGRPARRPWRAWQTFQVALAGAFLAFLAFLGASLASRLRHGELTRGEAQALLGLLYWGTYPLVFVALGALAWHLVRFYRGDYARR